MDFGLDDEQRAFRDAVRAFAQRVLAPSYQDDDRGGRLRPELVRQCAAQGLTGLRISERYGGQGAGAVEAGIAAEQVGRAHFDAAYLIIIPGLVGDIIERAATPAQRAAWLPPIAAGGTLPALCVTEPGHGTDAAHLQLKAVHDQDHWRLDGEKTSITLGMDADTAVILARTGEDGPAGLTAFYAELDDEHVTRAGFDDLGARCIGRASLHFDGLCVPDDRVIGRPGQGFTHVMRGFDYSRAVIALACLGAAQASLDEALAWVRDRTAFGEPIGRFQGVTFPLVEHATRLAGARHLCYEALWRKDHGLPHSTQAAMAKLWAPRLAAEVIHQCLLTFGHLGYSADSPLGQRLRDVIGLEIGDGTAQACKLVIGRQLLGREFAP